MNETHATMVRELRELLRINPPDLAVRGDEILARLRPEQDPEVVRELLSLFDDEGDHQDLLWSMLHGIETLPGARYATELLAAAPRLGRTSKDWFEVILLRSIRDADTLSALRSQLARANAALKSDLRPLLEFVRRENPDEQARLDALLQVLV